MTTRTNFYSVNDTMTAPGDLLGTTISFQCVGSASNLNGSNGNNGMAVQGIVPNTVFPLTFVIGQPPTVGVGSGGPAFNGGGGYSGGGSGEAGAGAGSTAILTGSPLTVLCEAGGGSGDSTVAAGSQFGAGGAGGFTGNGGSEGLGTGYGGGGGGGSGGSGGVGGTGGLGGVGYGGGPSGLNATPGPGQQGGAGGGTGGVFLPPPNDFATGSSFVASTVSSVVYSWYYASVSGFVNITYTVADAPAKPNLETPVSGAFLDTNSLGVTLTATYDTPMPDSGSLAAVALSLSIDGGVTHYWNGIDFSSLVSVWLLPTTGAGATQSEPFTIIIPPGVLANGHVYTWAFATQESFYNIRGPFSSTFAIHAEPAPVTSILHPLGDILNDLTPIVNWPVDADQISYRYVLYDYPTPTPGIANPNLIYDSTTVLSGLNGFIMPSVSLRSGDSYYGYLMITTTGGNPSAWAEGTFTILLTGGDTPVLAAYTSVEPTSGMPAPLLVATFNDSLIPSLIFCMFQFSYDLSGPFTEVLDGNGQIGTQLEISMYDLGAPFNVPLYYQCRTFYIDLSYTPSQFIFSDWSNIVEAVVPSTNWWIVPWQTPNGALQLHRLPSSGAGTSNNETATPTSPAMPSSMVASILIDEWEQMGVFRPFGKATATIVHGDIWNDEFDLDLYFLNTDEWTKFKAIRNLQQVVLIKSDMEGSIYWVTLGPDLNPGIVSRASRQVNPTRGLTIHCTPTDAPI